MTDEENRTDEEKQWDDFVSDMQKAGWIATYTLWGKVANWRHRERDISVDGEGAFNAWKRGFGTPAPF